MFDSVLTIALGAILINNFIFSQFLGCCPFLGCSTKIDTAIGMGISEELGGYVTLTVAMIIITGILGNVIAVAVCRVFRITEPIAKGVAIGSAAHALGTAKAIEIGEVEGAMSGLSIAVAGVLTAVLCPFFVSFIQ